MEYLSPKDGGLLSSPERSKVDPSPKRFRSELLLLGLFLVSTAGLALLCDYAAASPVPIVRVMVERERQGIRIEGFDVIVSEVDTNRKLAHESSKAVVKIQCSLGGRMEIDLGNRRKTRASGPVQVSSLGGFVRVGSNQYRDELYVYSFNGDCIVVNHVDLEKYVAGLLNSEMSANWSKQTLSAQAVAARTYAIYQMKEASTARFRSLRPPFDLDSSVKDQVYEGAHKERYGAVRAVQETRGMILTYDGKPIKAFYHSTCGGKTETADRVWGMRLPYIRSVRCGFCDRSPRFNWTYAPNTREVESRLREQRLVQGALMGMRVVERNNLGRASKVEVRGSQGTMVVNAIRIRDLFGTANIRSTDFSVVRNPVGGYVFVGHGSGHGVGMCQYGAKRMGEQGRTFAQILKHYYPEATLSKLY